MRFSLPALLTVAVACSPALAQTPASTAASVDKAAKTIHGDAIRAHMRFLSSTELAGRGTGTPGYQIAAEYVAAQMEALGLKPAGAGDSWYQPVRLRDYRVVPQRTSLHVVRDGHPEALKFGDDFVVSGDALKTDVSVDAAMVFVGFGITAPDRGYDDYANVDVRGKVVVTIFGAPSSFPAIEQAYFSDMVNKARIAVGHGAVASLVIMTPEDQQRYAWNWLAPQIASGGMNWLGADGVPHDTFPEQRGSALLSQRGAELIFAGAPVSLAQVFTDAKAGKLRSFVLPGRVQMRTVSTHAEVQSPNVVGVLRGSDARLRSEYVVYTAHLDHLGICPPVDGDNVCHGAADNASGTAVLLEIARAFAALPEPPRRSVLFVFVTAEEKGLLGSDYFANNPTVPLSAIVADVNLDSAVGLFYSPRDIVALGGGHSTLGANVETAAKRLGYAVSPDPATEAAVFTRLDLFSFVKKGVPAVTLGDGFESDDPKMDREAIAKLEKWMTTAHHTPRDNMDQPFSWESTTKGAILHFLLGDDIAEQPQRPTWIEGDFFAKRFVQMSDRSR